MKTADAHEGPHACENCGTMLQGAHCHVCGQRAHNPLKHLGHAVEEVFESFWHLDGRIFRTMRDLPVPGRVAAAYLAGHRVRYIAPLRLFVVLTLLTLFVAHGVIRIGPDAAGTAAKPRAIADATTVDEAIRLRDARVRELSQARIGVERSALATQAIDAAIAQTAEEARARIARLGATGAAAPAAGGAPGQPAEEEHSLNFGATVDDEGVYLDFGENRFDPGTDTVRIGWLPDSVNRWLTDTGRRAARNYQRAGIDPDRLKDAWLNALPTALLVMLPVFALLLKLVYAFTPRTYLEHLVVALYSHAWLMIATLLLLVCSQLIASVGSSLAWIAVPVGIAMAVLQAWTALYLLLMQKRVYGQGWPLTLLKYAGIGFVYMTMLAFAMVTAAAIGLVKM